MRNDTQKAECLDWFARGKTLPIVWGWILIGAGIFGVAIIATCAWLILPPHEPISTESQPAPNETQIVVQWPMDDPLKGLDSKLARQTIGTVRLLLMTKSLFRQENTLVREAAGAYRDTGNDIGSGTLNVYLLSATPKAAVARIIYLYKNGDLAAGMRIGVAHYTNAARTDWTYQSVFPPGAKDFVLQ